MSDFIHATLVGQAHIEEIFDEFPEVVRRELYRTTADLTRDLKAAVIQDIHEATRPKTHKLENSVRDEVYNDPDSIKGRVWTTAGAKAVALEYGAHGTGRVKPYTKRLTHLWSQPISSIYVQVPGYARTQDVGVHSFMRKALAGLEGKVVDGYEQALEGAAEKTQEALDGNAV